MAFVRWCWRAATVSSARAQHRAPGTSPSLRGGAGGGEERRPSPGGEARLEAPVEIQRCSQRRALASRQVFLRARREAHRQGRGRSSRRGRVAHLGAGAAQFAGHGGRDAVLQHRRHDRPARARRRRASQHRLEPLLAAPGCGRVCAAARRWSASAALRQQQRAMEAPHHPRCDGRRCPAAARHSGSRPISSSSS